MSTRNLSGSLIAALAAVVTKPGLLVDIHFASGTIYLGSRGDITIGGNTYSAADLDVSGLAADAKGEQRGTLKVGATDGTIGALILAEQNADWRVVISVYDAAAVADLDVVQIFDGTASGAGGDERWATIDLTSTNTRTQLIPAEYITAEQGFSFLPPAGMRIDTGGGTIYVLQPSRV